MSQKASGAAKAPVGRARQGGSGRPWGCQVLAFHWINRKFRMSGLGEGSAHEVAGSPWVLLGAGAVLLTCVCVRTTGVLLQVTIAWAPPWTNM